jgi:cytochrome c
LKGLLMFAVWTLAIVMIGCVQDWRAELMSHTPAVRDSARRLTGGDPGRGRDAIRRFGCQACHIIPGIPGGPATVGPTLIHFTRRNYSPDTLINSIQHPRSVKPDTLMPETGMKENDARDIAAYLYTLR